jgi:hypothetical protein
MPVSGSSAATASGVALYAAAGEKMFRVIAYTVSPSRSETRIIPGLAVAKTLSPNWAGDPFSISARS